ncbi:MAG TPA: hypothetical protein VEK08_04700 [Planctomycetota bacterium]|nr:hypothetical protein [Planctomycetota bacterium]
MSDEFEAGDIIRDAWPQPGDEALLLGNGRLLARLDAFGFPAGGLFHAEYSRENPLVNVSWEGEAPAVPKLFTQELRLVHGYCHTEMDWPNLSVTFVCYAHPEKRELFAFHLSYEVQGKGAMPPLLLTPAASARTLQLETEFWRAEIKDGDKAALLGLNVYSSDGSAELARQDGGVRVSFKGREGRHLLLIGAAPKLEVNAEGRRDAGGPSASDDLLARLGSIDDPADLLEESIDGWHRRWGDVEIELPDDAAQALYERSQYQLLSCCSGELLPAPAELAALYPALLRGGHVDIVRGWAELCGNALATLPLDAIGAVASLARETALHLRDENWTLEVAIPLLSAAVRRIVPFIESGKSAAPLAELKSAQQTLQAAAAMNVDLLQHGIDANALRTLAERRALSPEVGSDPAQRLLSAAHSRNSAAFLEALAACNAVHAHFSLAQHGLFVQAINDALVSDKLMLVDANAKVELASACPDSWSDVRVENFRVASGIAISGERKSGQWSWRQA